MLPTKTIAKTAVDMIFFIKNIPAKSILTHVVNDKSKLYNSEYFYMFDFVLAMFLSVSGGLDYELSNKQAIA